jgi:hypothetical protein
VQSSLVLVIGQRRGIMPRKPNYRFERFERERTRAAKKAARAQAKAEKKAKASEASIDQDRGAEDYPHSADDDPNSD